MVDSELVYQTATGPEEEYAFKHALTEEVAYGSQLAKRRTRIHASVAGHLAELETDGPGERAALIAHHYELGGEPLEAARWNARAATWAGFSHPLEAVRHWRRVRALTDELEQSPEVLELAVNARLMLLSCHWRLGAASEEGSVTYEDEAAAVFAEGETFAEATAQSAVKVILLSLYGAVRMMSDAVEDGHGFTLRATRLADEAGDRGLRVSARIALAWNLFVLGRAPEAAAMAEEISTMIGDDRSIGRAIVMTSPYAWCRMAQAFFAGHCERIDDELAAIGESLELLRQEGGRREPGSRPPQLGGDRRSGRCRPCPAAAEHAVLGLKWAEEAGGPWCASSTGKAWPSATPSAVTGFRRSRVVDEALAIARSRRIALANVPFLLATRHGPRSASEMPAVPGPAPRRPWG